MTEQIQLQQSFWNSRGVHVVPTCSITIITLTNTSSAACYSEFSVRSQPNVFELWWDTPMQCTLSTSFIRQRAETNVWVEKWNSVWSKLETAEVFVHLFLWLPYWCFTPSWIHLLHLPVCNPSQCSTKCSQKDGHSLFTIAYNYSKTSKICHMARLFLLLVQCNVVLII